MYTSHRRKLPSNAIEYGDSFHIHASRSPFNAYEDQLSAQSYGLRIAPQASDLALTELASAKKDARRSAIHDRITDSWSPSVRLRARISGREIARMMNEEQKVDLGSPFRLSLCVLIVVRSARRARRNGAAKGIRPATAR